MLEIRFLIVFTAVSTACTMSFQMPVTTDLTSSNAFTASPLMVSHAARSQPSTVVMIRFHPATSSSHQVTSQPWMSFHTFLMSPQMVFHAVLSHPVTVLTIFSQPCTSTSHQAANQDAMSCHTFLMTEKMPFQMVVKKLLMAFSVVVKKPLMLFQICTARPLIVFHTVARNPETAFHTWVTIAFRSFHALPQRPVTRSRNTLKMPTITSQATLIAIRIPATATLTTAMMTSQTFLKYAEMAPQTVFHAISISATPILISGPMTSQAALRTPVMISHSVRNQAEIAAHRTCQTFSTSSPWDFHQLSNPPVIAFFTVSNTFTISWPTCSKKALIFPQVSLIAFQICLWYLMITAARAIIPATAGPKTSMMPASISGPNFFTKATILSHVPLMTDQICLWYFTIRPTSRTIAVPMATNGSRFMTKFSAAHAAVSTPIA